MKEKQYDEYGRVIRENRSALKREREKIKQFAETLLKLSAQQYPLLPIDETLKKALIEGKRLNGNAYQRHLNYLTRLIIEQDPEAIKKAHKHIDHTHPENQQRIQKEIQALLENAPNIYQQLSERYLDLDLQQLRQMQRELQKSATPETHPKYKRLQKFLQQQTLKT